VVWRLRAENQRVDVCRSDLQTLKYIGGRLHCEIECGFSFCRNRSASDAGSLYGLGHVPVRVLGLQLGVGDGKGAKAVADAFDADGGVICHRICSRTHQA
jgi:hypothetical protein